MSSLPGAIRARHRWTPIREEVTPRLARNNWSVAGGVAGYVFGGPIGGEIGATIGGMAQGLFGPSQHVYADKRYSTVSYGTPIARVWGAGRVNCGVVWAERSSYGEYMTEVDEGSSKKGDASQHWFCTICVVVAETGFTFPDGSQIERKITINRIWAGDEIIYANPAIYNTPWLSGTTYNFGDIVKASDGYFYSSLADGNIGENPSGGVHPLWWQKISAAMVTNNITEHPGPSESCFVMAADSTITTHDGVSVTSANRGFHNFVLTSFDTYYCGNTIPQNVTVECATAAVTDGDVLSDLARLCGVPLSRINFTACQNPCTGFTQDNRMSGEEMMNNFCLAKGYDLTEIDGYLMAIPRGSQSVATIPDSDTGATIDGVKPGDRLPTDTMADFRPLHSQISVRYRSLSQFFRIIDILSPSRGDCLTENPWQFETNMSLNDDEAAQMAARLIDIEWLEAGGKFGPLKLAGEHGYLVAGAVVYANDNGSLTRFRITDFDWVPGLVTLSLVRDEVQVLIQNNTGDAGQGPILPGQLSVAAFMIASPVADASAKLAAFPGFYVWARTTPARVPVTIYYSYDNFATFVVGPTINYQHDFGVTQTTALADASGPGYETTSYTDVKYVISKLMSSDSNSEDSVKDGVGIALIGNEWVGVVSTGAVSGGVQQIGPGLIREVQGSVGTGHVTGEQYAIGNLPSNINKGNICKVQVDPAHIGQTVYVQCLTRSQELGDVPVQACVIQAPVTMVAVNPSTVTACATSYSGTSEIATFNIELGGVPPSGQSYYWQYSTNAGSSWSSSVVGGASYTPPSFTSGTMRVRAQAILTSGQTGAWVSSTDVTYSAPPQNFQETPSGTINGTNTTFGLTHSPRSGTLLLYLNGALTTAYTLTGSTITMTTAPAVSSTLYASYTY